MLSLTLPWGYAVLGDTVEWTVSPWLVAAAWVPAAITAAFGIGRRPAAQPATG